MRSKILVVLFMLATGSAALASSLNCPDGVVAWVAGRGADQPRKGRTAEGVTLPVLKSKKDLVFPSVPGHRGRVAAKVSGVGTVDVDGKTGDFVAIDCTATRNGVELRGDDKEAYCTAFAEASAKTFAGWRFAPARRDGKPICVHFAVRIEFARK